MSFVYGFIFCVICNIALSASVGELASLYPTAGGQYHYAYALSTKKWRKLTVNPTSHSLAGNQVLMSSRASSLDGSTSLAGSRSTLPLHILGVSIGLLQRLELH